MGNNEKIPKWFWTLTIISLLWNIMGVGSFFMHTFISAEALEALPVAERELYESYPLWTEIVFAIAVFGGLLGAIGLVLKKKWSKLAFIISLLAIIPQMTHNMFATESLEVYGPQASVMPILVVILGAVLVWFSIFGIKKNWLK
ncbi:MAG: hypothetical protein HN704_07360 [Bacteroidetes bacterium]|jgi:hypothetical protein|nr:hypothetical protein [Bacteroidota bacterium]MBT6687632.1 hypothetical protein [Bacteroidota bacterium]MBT7144779.1 hypothetical protein [Bacteroidota bacterium]MBT7491406.1 hypothetical protein [Bacteroidota bacterium]